jgi:nucleotide-binding universal stress UspA family protein
MTSTDLPSIQPPRSILVGVVLHDEDSGAAIATASAYAAALGAELILAGVAPIAEPVRADVVTGLGPPALAPIAEQQTLDRLAREQLADAAARVPEHVASRTVLNWGPVGTVLVETAETESADLIVVPMRHAGALGHILNDGTDRYVLHHSSVPVLVVPAQHERSR